MVRTRVPDLVVQENAPVVNKVTPLVNQYRDLFVDGTNDELGRTSVTEHSINTKIIVQLNSDRTEHLCIYKGR